MQRSTISEDVRPSLQAVILHPNGGVPPDVVDVLKEEDFDVVSFEHLEAARAHCETREPALVVLGSADEALLRWGRDVPAVREGHAVVLALVDEHTDATMASMAETGLDDCLVRHHDRPILERRLRFVRKRVENRQARYRTEAELRARVRQQAAVARFGQEALEGLPLNELFRRATALVAEALDAPFAKVLEWQPEAAHFVLRGAWGWDEALVGEATVPAGSVSQAGYTLEAREPVVMVDARQEDRFSLAELLTSKEVCSGVSVVVVGEARPYGVLTVHDRRPRRYNQHDIHFLSSVANVLAGAIDRAASLQALIEGETRYRLLVETTGNAIIRLDAELTITEWNQGAERLHGWTRQEAIGRSVAGMVPESEQQAFLDRLRAVARAGAQEPYEGEVKRTDGERCIVLWNLTRQSGAAPAGAGIIMAGQDITDRMVYEEQLRVRNRAMAEASNGITIADATQPDLPLIFCNRGFTEITGYTEEEALGSNCRFLQGRGTDQEVVDQIRACLQSGSDGQFVLLNYRKSGRPFWNELSISPVHDDAGQVTHFVGIQNDVTHRMRIEEDLRTERDFLEGIMETTVTAILLVDAQGHIVFANHRAEEVMGVGARDITDRSFDDPRWHITDVDGNAVAEAELPLRRVLETGKPVRGIQLATSGESGERRMLSVSGAPLRSEDGTIANVVFSVEDITEQLRAEQALQESTARVQAILDTTVDAIVTIDERGIIESFNLAAERIFGYSADEAVGRNVSILMPQPYREEHDTYIHNYLDTGRRQIIGIGREVTGRRKDGSVFPMDLAVSEVPLGDRRIFTGIIRDISDRRWMEQEILRISEQERRRIGQDLHDGLGQMLTGTALIAQNVAQRLKKQGEAGADDVKEIMELIREADQFARALARGLVPVELEANGLADALRRLASNAERLFGIRCTFETAGAALIHDNTVATHLYRIAQEAVSNAVKHGKATVVSIHLAAGTEQSRLRIKDDGIGFPEELPEERGMGVRIMNYRARIIGATLEIRAGTGGGTSITCTLRRRSGASADD